MMSATFRSRLALTMLLCFWLSLVLWAPYGVLEAREAPSDSNISQDPSQENVHPTDTQTTSGALLELNPKSSDLPVVDKVSARIRRRDALLSKISSTKASIADQDNRRASTAEPEVDVLSNVFISVKTARQNHRVRLPGILQTWFQLARKQVGCFVYLQCREGVAFDYSRNGRWFSGNA